MQLNSDEIEKLLPHRYPFLLVDRITELEPGKSVTGRKCVTADEPFFQGHFPGKKLMPGVLILEALAQTAAVAILIKEENKGKIALFGGVKSARFRRQVVPGDVLELKCEIISMKEPAGIGKATAFVDGETAVSAELIFALADK